MPALYQLTEEHLALRDLVRELVDTKVRPRADEIDRRGEFPYDMFELFKEHQLYGLTVPEEYGGTNLGYVSAGIVYEEINKACMSTAFVIQTQLLAIEPLVRAASHDQKELYLRPLATGEKIGAYALTEPNAGSDVASMQTFARRDGDGYRITGEKIFISNGSIADIVIVFARTSAERSSRAISAFIVEKGTPGFTYGKDFEKLGLRGSPTSHLRFEDCWVPKENLIGQEGDGLQIALKSLETGRALHAAISVGSAQGCLDYAVDYARQRVQFGRPIAEFQGIQFMLADRAAELEAARQLTYKALSLADQEDPELSRIGPMAKLFASQVALRTVMDAMQVLGGHGYMKHHPLERMLRDMRFLTFGEGTSEIQKIVIARQLFKDS